MAPVRVMLVEDSLYTRSSLQALLKRLPELSVVAHARDVEEALRLMQATEPQVLILDIKMSTMIGSELLDEGRKMNSTVQIIVLSTSQDDTLKQYALEKGAVAVVSKDDPHLFLDTLQRVTDSYNL